MFNKISLKSLLLTLLVSSVLSSLAQAQTTIPTVTRLSDGPIIVPHMDGSMGSNIQGPSLIEVPDWLPNPLGKYYLYFADHRGGYIRLAYADDLLGPWYMHEPGSLQLQESHFPTTCPPCSLADGASGALYPHIASPDVHVRDDLRQIVMYFHGRDEGQQLTRLAYSPDGINFSGRSEVLGRPYFRVIEHEQYFYGLSMPGYLYRSANGIADFELGPRFFNDNMRHSALLIRDNNLYVFWTQAGHAPEHIMLSMIDLQGDWMNWRESDPVEILRPEMSWEGSNLDINASRRGHIDIPVNQLRDPAIFEADGEVYLLYSVAGESGIAIAKLEFD